MTTVLSWQSGSCDQVRVYRRRDWNTGHLRACSGHTCSPAPLGSTDLISNRLMHMSWFSVEGRECPKEAWTFRKEGRAYKWALHGGYSDKGLPSIMPACSLGKDTAQAGSHNQPSSDIRHQQRLQGPQVENDRQETSAWQLVWPLCFTTYRGAYIQGPTRLNPGVHRNRIRAGARPGGQAQMGIRRQPAPPASPWLCLPSPTSDG